jgi:hypothetical protein
MAISKVLIVSSVTCAAALGIIGALVLTYNARGSAKTPVAQSVSTSTLANRERVQPAIQTKSANQATSAMASKQATKEQLGKSVDWAKKYYGAVDYFEFVSNAAKSAVDGDGRAALYISQALNKCLGQNIEYAKSSNPEADFNAKVAAQPNLPQWVLDKERKDFQACAGFLKGDAFANLPERPGGYLSASYWMTQAYNDGDPLALAFHAGSDLTTASLNANVPLSSSAQTDIENAVASRDPGAIFQVGQILAGGRYSNSPLQGFALAIAACDLGYDCSANNPALATYLGCGELGTCPPGFTYADVIKKAVGNDGYTDAYSRAQEIENALANGDRIALGPFVKVKTGS